ncbi:predicted protein [Coccidioides posadasii str. Silveira]|uniref:Predicted protein n=1 Tax=Coccidioides posadasii (strain RMSCC 757 / Silveira) TaxID=443226 RepID=E9DGB3_COCPS|nr:predicted protein [Coccidioides posadasii str. Silveira]
MDGSNCSRENPQAFGATGARGNLNSDPSELLTHMRVENETFSAYASRISRTIIERWRGDLGFKRPGTEDAGQYHPSRVEIARRQTRKSHASKL